MSADTTTTEHSVRTEPEPISSIRPEGLSRRSVREKHVSQEVISEVLNEVDDLIISAMNEHILPGLGVGIIHGGRPVYLRSFGLAEIEQGEPVTPKTIFRIGSISKTFTPSV